MTFEKLVEQLIKMHSEAEKYESTTMIRLFGIRYAIEIQDCGESRDSIAIAAGLGKCYGTEIGKGVNLAKYVIEK